VNEVETARLHLRLLEPADLDAYYERIFADPDVMRWLPTGQPIPRERFDDRIASLMFDHWAEHGFGPWIAVHRADGRVIGHCGLKHWPESTEVEVFYAFAKSYWGQGLATEGARASLRYGFEDLGLDRISAAAKLDNAASRRVLEKIGMTHEKDFEFMGSPVAGYAVRRADWRPDGSAYRVIVRA
jgi:ribosomal-protein-alanine N-acetyltransferase